jgi:hypothetical protein
MGEADAHNRESIDGENFRSKDWQEDHMIQEHRHQHQRRLSGGQLNAQGAHLNLF